MSPAEAGRDHTSHRIKALGLGNRSTVITLYAMCALFGLLGLLVSITPTAQAFVIGTVGIIALLSLFVAMVWVREKRQKMIVRE